MIGEQIYFKIAGYLDFHVLIIVIPIRFWYYKRFLSYYQKRTILPYVLFLVTAAMLVGRMETNEEVL